jgi:hypothetical protein
MWWLYRNASILGPLNQILTGPSPVSHWSRGFLTIFWKTLALIRFIFDFKVYLVALQE